MTKKEMTQIILGEFDRAWENVKRNEELFGKHSPMASMARNEWAPLFELCQKLGLKR